LVGWATWARPGAAGRGLARDKAAPLPFLVAVALFPFLLLVLQVLGFFLLSSLFHDLS